MPETDTKHASYVFFLSIYNLRHFSLLLKLHFMSKVLWLCFQKYFNMQTAYVMMHIVIYDIKYKRKSKNFTWLITCVGLFEAG